jgi:hypothetical protein
MYVGMRKRWPGKVLTSEHRTEGNEKVSSRDTWGKSNGGIRKSKCPEVGIHLICAYRSKRTSVAGTEKARGRVVGRETSEGPCGGVENHEHPYTHMWESGHSLYC